MASFSAPVHFDFVDLRLYLNVAESGSLTAGARDSALSLAAASTRITAETSSVDEGKTTARGRYLCCGKPSHS